MASADPASDSGNRAATCAVRTPSASRPTLWVGLHGLAHQQSVTVSFPWPPDIAERLVVALGHLTDA